MMGEKLNNIYLIFGRVIASAGVVGAWFVLPHRVSSNEAAIKVRQADGKSEKEMLIGIAPERDCEPHVKIIDTLKHLNALP